jgi:hypothetical protein
MVIQGDYATRSLRIALFQFLPNAIACYKRGMLSSNIVIVIYDMRFSWLNYRVKS